MVPPSPIPISQSVFIDAGFFSPIGEAHGSSIKSQMDVVSSVSLLLTYGCPSAVAGFVSAARIDAVNCVTGRPLSHISKKIGKGPAPAVADCYACRAIARVTSSFWVVASGNHVRPCPVRRRPPLASLCVPMLCHVGADPARPAAVFPATGSYNRLWAEKLRAAASALTKNLSVFHGAILHRTKLAARLEGGI